MFIGNIAFFTFTDIGFKCDDYDKVEISGESISLVNEIYNVSKNTYFNINIKGSDWSSNISYYLNGVEYPNRFVYHTKFDNFSHPNTRSIADANTDADLFLITGQQRQVEGPDGLLKTDYNYFYYVSGDIAIKDNDPSSYFSVSEEEATEESSIYDKKMHIQKSDFQSTRGTYLTSYPLVGYYDTAGNKISEYVDYIYISFPSNHANIETNKGFTIQANINFLDNYGTTAISNSVTNPKRNEKIFDIGNASTNMQLSLGKHEDGLNVFQLTINTFDDLIEIKHTNINDYNYHEFYFVCNNDSHRARLYIDNKLEYDKTDSNIYCSDFEFTHGFVGRTYDPSIAYTKNYSKKNSSPKWDLLLKEFFCWFKPIENTNGITPTTETLIVPDDNPNYFVHIVSDEIHTNAIGYDKPILTNSEYITLEIYKFYNFKSINFSNFDSFTIQFEIMISNSSEPIYFLEFDDFTLYHDSGKFKGNTLKSNFAPELTLPANVWESVTIQYTKSDLKLSITNKSVTYNRSLNTSIPDCKNTYIFKNTDSVNNVKLKEFKLTLS